MSDTGWIEVWCTEEEQRRRKSQVAMVGQSHQTGTLSSTHSSVMYMHTLQPMEMSICATGQLS